MKEVQTGLLHEEEDHDQPTTSDTKPEPLVAMQETGVVDIGERCATGVAKLHGSIYILCKNPSSIVIHRDESPFDRTGEVSLEDVEAPYDLASSTKSSCLYLTDCKGNRVHKMTLPSQEVSRWGPEIGYPHTLSVTSPEDQVLLLMYESPSRLEIYGPDAKQVRCINLPDEIEYPKHAVGTSGGNYVISGKVKGSEAWGVFEMNVDGKILHRLTQANHLTESYHLAIDSADRLIVADCWNNRLAIIDAKLSRCEELLPKNSKGLKWPWRLHYVASDNQVLVLEHDGKVGRGVPDGEKDAAEDKTKELAPEKKIAKDEEKEKATEEEEETHNDEEDKATTEEKKADEEEDEEKVTPNGKVTEKTEGEDKKRGEEEEGKKDEGEEEEKRDKGHAIVHIYNYI